MFDWVGRLSCHTLNLQGTAGNIKHIRLYIWTYLLYHKSMRWSAGQLQVIVDTLNRPDKTHRFYPQWLDKAKQLLAAWDEAGRDLNKMALPPGAPDLNAMQANLRVFLNPRAPASGETIVYHPKRDWTAWDFACQLFLQLLTNPQSHLFGGPCPRPATADRPACGKYFLRAGKKSKRYCSSECASRMSAKESTLRDRETKRIVKLELACEAIREYGRSRMHAGWKSWVVNYARELQTSKRWSARVVTGNKLQITEKWLARAVEKGELEISQKWLTRAVNDGKLQPPTERKNHAKG